MTLQTSGPITLDDIATEFGHPNAGGGGQVFLSEFYSGGAYVPASVDVPASGALSVDDFYGKSSAPTISTITLPGDFGIGQELSYWLFKQANDPGQSAVFPVLKCMYSKNYWFVMGYDSNDVCWNAYSKDDGKTWTTGDPEFGLGYANHKSNICVGKCGSEFMLGVSKSTGNVEGGFLLSEDMINWRQYTVNTMFQPPVTNASENLFRGDVNFNGNATTGLYKLSSIAASHYSTDDGQTWTIAYSSVNFANILNQVTDQVSTVMALSNPRETQPLQILVTENSGQTWTIKDPVPFSDVDNGMLVDIKYWSRADKFVVLVGNHIYMDNNNQNAPGTGWHDYYTHEINQIDDTGFLDIAFSQNSDKTSLMFQADPRMDNYFLRRSIGTTLAVVEEVPIDFHIIKLMWLGTTNHWISADKLGVVRVSQDNGDSWTQVAALTINPEDLFSGSLRIFSIGMEVNLLTGTAIVHLGGEAIRYGLV